MKSVSMNQLPIIDEAKKTGKCASVASPTSLLKRPVFYPPSNRSWSSSQLNLSNASVTNGKSLSSNSVAINQMRIRRLQEIRRLYRTPRLRNQLRGNVDAILKDNLKNFYIQSSSPSGTLKDPHRSSLKPDLFDTQSKIFQSENWDDDYSGLDENFDEYHRKKKILKSKKKNKEFPKLPVSSFDSQSITSMFPVKSWLENCDLCATASPLSPPLPTTRVSRLQKNYTDAIISTPNYGRLNESLINQNEYSIKPPTLPRIQPQNNISKNSNESTEIYPVLSQNKKLMEMQSLSKKKYIRPNSTQLQFRRSTHHVK